MAHVYKHSALREMPQILTISYDAPFHHSFYRMRLRIDENRSYVTHRLFVQAGPFSQTMGVEGAKEI